MKTITIMEKEEILIDIAFIFLACKKIPTVEDLERCVPKYIEYLKEQKNCRSLTVDKNGTMTIETVADIQFVRDGISKLMDNDDPAGVLQYMFPGKFDTWKIIGKRFMEDEDGEWDS